MAVSENSTALPFAHLPRGTLEAIAELVLAELDRRDGDPDLEWEEDELAAARYGALDEGAGDDDDAEDTHDAEVDVTLEHSDQPNHYVSAALSPVTNLFAGRAVEVRHG